MQRFKDISKKIVSIKALTKKKYLDSEEKGDTVSTKVTRESILKEALVDIENVSTKVLYNLCKALLAESSSTTSGGTPSLFYALVLMEWMINQNIQTVEQDEEGAGAGLMGGLMTSGKIAHTSAKTSGMSQFSPGALIKWAEAHFEYWSRKGVAAEEYHLQRAKELFEQAFRRSPELKSAATLFTQCKVLTLLGEMEAASQVALALLTAAEHDPEYPNYLFFTGGIFKALQQHERANNYFFEASQIGPPKLFSKLEVMIIISRTIEEQTADEETEQEDAYRMVHAHMLLEGLIEEGLDYDDWISHSHTWLSLGDKCSMHHMYSLATDLYGLGIMKDPDAFRKPMLWLRFAKACKRCGRAADGLLAVKQALTYDPFNAQLLRTQAFWSGGPTAFRELAQGPLSDILPNIPHSLDKERVVISRTQAILKGVLERRGMNLGVGNRRDITRRMTARIGVVLEDMHEGKAVQHPVILTVRPAWSGLITNIRVFDLNNDHLGAIPLRTPFAPMKETGVPRKLNLSLTCRTVTLRVNAQNPDSDDEEQVWENNRLVYRRKKPVFVDETVTELKFTFKDLLTGQYTCRRMKLSLNDVVPNTLPLDGVVLGAQEFSESEYRVVGGSDSVDAGADSRPRTAGNNKTELGSRPDSRATTPVVKSGRPSINDPLVPGFRPSSRTSPRPSVVNRLSLSDDNAVSAVTETNIESAEILRQGFQYNQLLYMVRIINDVDVTQVTMLQLRSNRVFAFILTREHIDRTLNIKKRLLLLMDILATNPLVKPLLEGQRGLRADEAAVFENPCICLGKHCFVNLHPRSEGATLILLDPNSRPILGDGFEIMEDNGVLLDTRPGSVKVSRGGARQASMRRMPSKRFSISTKSFRNNAIDEFLNGNLCPPPVDYAAEEARDVMATPPMLGGGARKAINTLPSIASRSALSVNGDDTPSRANSRAPSALNSMTPSRANSRENSHPSVGFEGVETPEKDVVKEEVFEGVEQTPAQHTPEKDVKNEEVALSPASSECMDEEDTFELAPLPIKSSPAVSTASAAMVPVSLSGKMGKRPARDRAAAAKLRSIARRNMTDGGTFKDALTAATALQEKMAEFDIQQQRSSSSKVSWAAWEAQQAEDQQKIEAGEPLKSLVTFDLPTEVHGGQSEQSGKSASDFLVDGDEETFLKSIVDVPWIEELGSIEVVEYVTLDLLDAMLRATVSYIAEQYNQLPIFREFAEEVISQSMKKAAASLLSETQRSVENTVESALNQCTDEMVEEVFEEVVDDLTEERCNKLNVMAFKLAVAEKAREEEARTRASKKTVIIHASKPTPPPAAAAPVTPKAAVPMLTIELPEPEPEKPRVAAVAYVQPYRAAPDSPVSEPPVQYNVQKIIARPTATKNKSGALSKRDTFVPQLGTPPTANKKRHNPEFLLAAQTYHAPEYLGRTSPQTSIYMGTFSRSDAFPHGLDELDDASASVKEAFHTDRPNSRAHILELNTMNPLPVVDPLTDSVNPEVSQPTDPNQPSHRVEELCHRLEDWATESGNSGPLMTIARITEASQQPFKHSATSPTGRGQLAMAIEDDGAISICSDDDTDCSNPVFKTIQRRKLSLPLDEESIYSVGSASRAGARRSPNKRTMLDDADYSYSLDSMSLGDDSSIGSTSFVSLRSGTGHMGLLSRPDPLQVPPRGAVAAQKRRVVQDSLRDYKKIGYVKERPLVHSSYWRGKLFNYLASLRNANHLRKHVAMLAKATRVVLTPEEAVCALADTSGSVGEVAEKLKKLEFHSEIKLVCRSLHVRSMVCMLEGGDRLFKDSQDTFGERGEFDDQSVGSELSFQHKTDPSVEVTRSLQRAHSIVARNHKQETIPNFSRTLPLQPLAQHNAWEKSNFSGAGSLKQQHSAKGRAAQTAPTGMGAHKVSFVAGVASPSTAPPPGSLDEYGIKMTEGGDFETGESEKVLGLQNSEKSPTLGSMFHFERDDSMLHTEEDDQNSSVTMSLGSVSTRSCYQPPVGSAIFPPPEFPRPALQKTNTNSSINSGVSAGSASTGQQSAAMADRLASLQLTPGIRSMLSVPRKHSAMDVTAQAPSVTSKATYVPLKFTSAGGRRPTLADSLHGSSSQDKPSQMLLRRTSSDSLDSFEEDSHHHQQSQLQSDLSTGLGKGARSQTMSLFGQWGNNSLSNVRFASMMDAPPVPKSAAGNFAGPTSPVRHTLMHLSTAGGGDETDSLYHDSSPAPSPKKLGAIPKRASANSFRLNGRIDDLLEEHGDTPLAIMCRRDFLKAQQDEILLKSNKTYIRRPIEKKIGLGRGLDSSSFVGLLEGQGEE